MSSGANAGKNSVGMKMVLIPPGEFLMGSSDEQVEAALKVADEIKAGQPTKDRIENNERPQHKVIITKPFLMSATEVTVGQFKRFSITGYQTEAEKAAESKVAEAAQQGEKKQRQIAEEQNDVLRRTLYASEMSLAGQATESNEGINRAGELLGKWQNDRPDLRGWEWYFLKGLCHGDRTSMTGHTDRVRGVVWTSDGNRVISAGDDKTVRVWDPSHGKLLTAVDGRSALGRSVRWSPDRTRFASPGADGVVTVWDMTGRELFKLRDHQDIVQSVEWRPDGALLATASQDGTVKNWNAADGRLESTLGGHDKGANVAIWSPDGKRLAPLDRAGVVRRPSTMRRRRSNRRLRTVRV